MHNCSVPVTACWRTARRLPAKRCPKLRLQQHSEATVLADTILEEDQREAASVEGMADTLLPAVHTHTHTHTHTQHIDWLGFNGTFSTV